MRDQKYPTTGSAVSGAILQLFVRADKRPRGVFTKKLGLQEYLRRWPAAHSPSPDTAVRLVQLQSTWYPIGEKIRRPLTWFSPFRFPLLYETSFDLQNILTITAPSKRTTI